MERHSTELAYSFAMGHFFSRDGVSVNDSSGGSIAVRDGDDHRREFARPMLQLGVSVVEPARVFHESADWRQIGQDLGPFRYIAKD